MELIRSTTQVANLSSYIIDKIMVFQKRVRKNAEFRFLIDNQIIDVVQEYTYLGTQMSSSGNFSVSREHLKEKALHALFSLRRHMNLSKLKAALACKVFDTIMISPILTSNSGIWPGSVCQTRV